MASRSRGTETEFLPVFFEKIKICAKYHSVDSTGKWLKDLLFDDYIEKHNKKRNSKNYFLLKTYLFN